MAPGIVIRAPRPFPAVRAFPAQCYGIVRRLSGEPRTRDASAPRTNMDGLERMLKATAEREGLDYFEMLTKR